MTRLGAWLRYRRRLAALVDDAVARGYMPSAEAYRLLCEQARRVPPPGALQLDLLSAVARLEQIRDEIGAGRGDFAFWLLTERVLTCDVPRLRGHLTAETLEWQALVDRELAR